MRRNTYRVGLTVSVIALTLAGTAAARGRRRGGGSRPPARAVADEPQSAPVVGPGVREALRADRPVDVFVMLRGGRTRAGVAALEADARAVQDRVLGAVGAGVTVRHRYRTIPAFVARVASAEGLERLAADPSVRKVDLDEGGGTGTLANVVPKIGANTLHAGGTRGAGVTVAVLDSGYDRDHPDLAGAGIYEACFGEDFAGGFCPNGTTRQTGAGAAEDDAGHGTHVTGIVTSNGTVSSVGVAPQSSVVAIKVTDNCSFAGCFYTFSEITAGLDHITAHPELGVDVVNMSLGTSALFTGDCDSATSWLMAGSTAVANLRAAGVLTFASAGNNGSTTQMTAPACLRNVIATGATTLSDTVASFSNTGATTDLLAPGVNVVSDGIGGGTATASGTSMASPAAAGCATLLKQRTSASVSEIEAALESTGVAVQRGALTFPRINCLAARDALNVAPTANAGPDQSLPKTATFTNVDGSGSTDPEGLPLGYVWTQIGGDPVVIQSRTSAKTRINGLVKGKTYTFRLRVTDQSGEVSTDDVRIAVKPK